MRYFVNFCLPGFLIPAGLYLWASEKLSKMQHSLRDFLTVFRPGSLFRKWVLAYLLLWCGVSGFGQASEKKIDRVTYQWLAVYSQIKLRGGKAILFDARQDFESPFATTRKLALRLGMGFDIAPKARLVGGVLTGFKYKDGLVDSREFRIYQELSIKNKFRPFSLKHRYRLEERFFTSKLDKPDPEQAFGWRMRYKASVSIPLFRFVKENKNTLVSLKIGDEVMINAGKRYVYNVFDKNRFVYGLSFSLGKALKAELLMNRQFSAKNKKASYKLANVFWFKLKHKLDLSADRNQN